MLAKRLCLSFTEPGFPSAKVSILSPSQLQAILDHRAEEAMSSCMVRHGRGLLILRCGIAKGSAILQEPAMADGQRYHATDDKLTRLRANELPTYFSDFPMESRGKSAPNVTHGAHNSLTRCLGVSGTGKGFCLRPVWLFLFLLHEIACLVLYMMISNSNLIFFSLVLLYVFSNLDHSFWRPNHS